MAKPVDLTQLFGPTPTETARRELLKLAGFTPNPAQEPILFGKSRQVPGAECLSKQVAGGERGGKSAVAGAFGYSYFPWSSLIWIIGPKYELARAEFEYMLNMGLKWDAVEPGSISMPKAPQPWSFRYRNGCQVETKSAEKPEQIASKAPDVLIMAEAAQQGYDAYLRARGRVAEKRSTSNRQLGHLFMCGTFEGSVGWYPELWEEFQNPLNQEDAQSFSLPSWANTAIYPGGRQDREILDMENRYDEAFFSERIAGVPMKPKGLVFWDFKQTLHVRDDLVAQAINQMQAQWPDGPGIELMVDPGYEHPYSVLWTITIDGTVYIVREYYEQHKLNEQIIDRAVSDSLWKYVRMMYMDVAGKTHANAERSPREIWEAKTHIPVQMQPVGVVDGITRTHSFLKPSLREDGKEAPRLYLTSQAQGLITEMSRDYKYPVDRQSKEVTSTIPIDLHNDSAKALAYGLVNKFGVVELTGGTHGAQERFVPVWERHRRKSQKRNRR